jgi:NADH-quinone oxidoreductase subunit E
MSVLSDEIKARIRELLPKYPSKQAVTLPALHMVHDAMRCVPTQAIVEIADLLDLAPAEVHDTMSFYQFFKDEDHKLGRTRLWVCRSISCALRGGDDLLQTFSDKLGVKPGETTSDGTVTLEFAECLGGCDGAPCVLVNDVLRGDVTPEQVDGIVSELRT